MSIQIVVCTPLAFYTNDLQSPDPGQAVHIWYDCIREGAGINIPIDLVNREFYRFDLSVNTHDRITDVVMREQEGLLDYYYADILLPVHRPEKWSIFIPNYIESATYQVASTRMVTGVMPEIREIIGRKLNGRELSDAVAEIEAYSRAITESERVKQPIFFSY
jgi:hypothetical protein